MLSSEQISILQLSVNDLELMEGLLDMFGEAFDEVETYSSSRPSHAYLKRLLSSDNFIAIAAFYSIIHVPRSLVADALREMKRVLRSKGVLLQTFHIGQQTNHIKEWFDIRVCLDFHFFEMAEMKDYLRTAGFELEEAVERDPFPEIEVQTRRAYIFAKKP